MKTMDRLYERLTPTERFQIAVAAFGRGDLTEVDRLNDAAPWREFRIQEVAYFDRLQRINWVALYFMVEARDLQVTILAAFSAIAVQLASTDGQGDETEQDGDEEFSSMHEVLAQRISRLKALDAAWTTFCASLGLSTADIDNMLGEPFLGRVGQLEVIAALLGEVTPDEEYEQHCLDVMTRFWNTKIRDRYRA